MQKKNKKAFVNFTLNNKNFLWELYCVSVWEDIFDVRIKSI